MLHQKPRRMAKDALTRQRTADSKTNQCVCGTMVIVCPQTAIRTTQTWDFSNSSIANRELHANTVHKRVIAKGATG